MTMTWDADYTFTGCVGFDVDGKWLCAALERTRVSTGVVYEVAASAEGECCDGDVATSVFRLSATDEGGEVKLDGALVGEVAWSGAESDFSASLTASDQGVDKFSVAVAADGEASDDDAYEGGLTGAVQLTVATDDDQLLTAATDDDQFEATLGGDLTWKKPKESTVQGCTCEGEEWVYSPVKEEDEDEEDYMLREGRCYQYNYDMSEIYSDEDWSWVSSISAQTCYDACVGADETMGVVIIRYGGQGSDGSCGCSYQSGKTLFPGAGESGIRAQARVPTYMMGRVSDPRARR